MLLCACSFFLAGIYFADSFDKSYGYCRDFQGSFGFVGGAQQQQPQFGGWGGGRRNNNNNKSEEEEALERSKCLLLCEVALGAPYLAHSCEYMEKCHPGTDSTQAVSSCIPDPVKSVYTADGVYIPNGPPILVAQPADWSPPPPPAAQTYFCTSQSEFIVYNEGQARMRYMVQVGQPRRKYLQRLGKFNQRRETKQRKEASDRNNIDNVTE